MKAVLVTTQWRGVFFGYAEETSGDVVRLKNARNVIYWPTSQRGFLGLASDGPKQGARVGPRVDIELRGVTAVVDVPNSAVKVWEAFEWTP